MAQFIVTGSGIVDLTGTNLSSFDGLDFQTSGAATAQVDYSQLTGMAGTPTFDGSAFADTVEVFVQSSGTKSGALFVLSNWTTGADKVVWHDSLGNDNITGTTGDDVFRLSGGIDNVGGGGGTNTLIADYSLATGNLSTSGNAITNFSTTQVVYTDIQRFNVTLGNGNDNVTTGAGDDTLIGGMGNDVLNMGLGAAVVDGGDGTDFWVADFTGDDTARTIDLSLSGVQSAGNGSSYANIERMNVTTGAGADVLTTRTDNANDGLADTLNSGLGNDTLTVGGGLDVVDGGDGEDLLIIDYSTDAGNFSTSGNNFTDFSNTQVVFAGIERFDITMGSGNDSIVAGALNDTMNGGAGNDSLNSGAGAAIIDGGDGTDFWIADLSANAASKTVNLTLSGVQVAGGGTTYAGIERLNLTLGNGGDTVVTFTNNANDGLSDTIIGGGGNDTITVGGGIDSVDGGAGTNDRLIVDYSTDSGNFGMNGAASISDFSNTSVSFTGFERYNLTMGSGNDNIVAGANDDTMSGGAGNDTLNSGTGAAVIDGGDGTDYWIADFTGDNTDKIIDLNLVGPQVAGNGTTYNSIERMSITTAGGNDVLASRTGNPNDGLADTLIGGAGNDTITVGGGSDVVDGGTGASDLLIVDYSTETSSVGMNGVAAFSDFSNTQVSFTGIERFNITLGSGADSIVAGAGNDTMSGGAGNDSLNSGTGAAVIDGGDGTDFWLADFSASAQAKSVDVNLSGVNAAGNGTTYANIERMSFLAGSGDDLLISRMVDANDGLSDTLNGGLGNDTLGVGGGIDVVDGGDGDDLLIVDYRTDTNALNMNGPSSFTDFTNTVVSFSGIERFDIKLGSGNDNIFTDAGNDTFDGGLGNDTYNANGGVDTIRHGTATGGVTVNVAGVVATITGAGVGTDAISNAEAYEMTSFNDVVNGGNAAELISGFGGLDRLNGFAGDDTLLGGGGNDKLTGGNGKDVLTGGGNADQFIFKTISSSANTEATADVITDFVQGLDTIDLSVIDALTGGVNDAFVWVGTAAFNAVGQARYFQSGGNTFVAVNTFAGQNPEMMIRLDGLFTLTAGDFDL